MNSLLSEASIISRSLGWALLNSIWQGLFIFICLNIILRIIDNGSARIKYYLSYFSLIGLFVWFINTWITQYQRLQGVVVYITEPGNVPHAIKTYYLNPSTTSFHTQYYIANALHNVEPYLPAIVCVYVAGLLFMLSRFIVNMIWLRKLRTKGLIKLGAEWHQLINQLQKRLNITKRVRLYVSEHVNVPMVMGVIKPVILLPIATINNMSMDQTEAILLHELGHIKRHDYLLNILQTLVETILFFNPFAWGITSKIRREREHCCDDMVVANSSQPLSYAKALAALETYRLSYSNSIALAATGQKKNQLFHRIKRIMEMRKGYINYSQLTIVLAIIIALTVSITLLTPSFAQSLKGSKQTHVISDSSTTGKTRIIIIDNNGNKKEYHSIDQIPDNVKEKLTDDNDHNKVRTSTTTIYSTSKNDKSDSSDDIEQTMTNVKDEVSKALSEINWQQIQDEVNNAMKEVDSKKMNAEIDEAQEQIKNIDWQKLKDEVDKGVAEADSAVNDPKLRKEIKLELDQALKDANKATKEAQKQIVEVYAQQKEVESNIKQQEAIDQVNTQQKKALAQARIEQDKALAEANGHLRTSETTNSMIKEMERDGLINQNDGFSIKKVNNSLYINGVKQSDEIYRKYSSYLEGEKVIIKGDKNHLKVDVRN